MLEYLKNMIYFNKATKEYPYRARTPKKGLSQAPSFLTLIELFLETNRMVILQDRDTVTMHFKTKNDLIRFNDYWTEMHDRLIRKAS